MAEIRHRTVRANGIRMHVAEAGAGCPGRHVPRLAGALVLLAAPARRARGRRLPRDRPGHARLRRDRRAGGPGRVPDLGHLRRHPGAPRRARARARGRRRPRLGRPSRLAVRPPASRPVPEAGRPQHALLAPGAGAADPDAPRAVRRGRLLHAVAPDARPVGGGARGRPPRQPPEDLQGLRARRATSGRWPRSAAAAGACSAACPRKAAS